MSEELESGPRHVAIIMDGNGRWAERRGLSRIEGHREGLEAVRDVVRAAGDLGVEVLTLYAFSIENWNRPQAEVDRADAPARALPRGGAARGDRATTSRCARSAGSTGCRRACAGASTHAIEQTRAAAAP